RGRADRASAHLEERGQELSSPAQSALVEGMGILRPLEAEVDAAGEAAARVRIVPQVGDESGGGMDRPGAADGDEEIAFVQLLVDPLHAERDLAEPDHVRPEEAATTVAARHFVEVRAVIVKGRPLAGVAEGPHPALGADPGAGQHEEPVAGTDGERRELLARRDLRQRDHASRTHLIESTVSSIVAKPPSAAATKPPSAAATKPNAAHLTSTFT